MLGHGEIVSGIRMEDAPAGQQREWLDKEDAKSTGQAVLELRARGLDASAAVLGCLTKKGVIRDPEGDSVTECLLLSAAVDVREVTAARPPFTSLSWSRSGGRGRRPPWAGRNTDRRCRR